MMTMDEAYTAVINDPNGELNFREIFHEMTGSSCFEDSLVKALAPACKGIPDSDPNKNTLMMQLLGKTKSLLVQAYNVGHLRAMEELSQLMEQSNGRTQVSKAN